jgi:hypothetical protein
LARRRFLKRQLSKSQQIPSELLKNTLDAAAQGAEFWQLGGHLGKPNIAKESFFSPNFGCF